MASITSLLPSSSTLCLEVDFIWLMLAGVRLDFRSCLVVVITPPHHTLAQDYRDNRLSTAACLNRLDYTGNSVKRHSPLQNLFVLVVR